MKKNRLILALGILSILSCFELTARLIPITIGANDTFELGAFESDNTTGTVTSATLFHCCNNETPSVIKNPKFTWYTFDTTRYKGGNKITRTIHPGKPNAFEISTYKYLFIDEKDTGTPPLWVKGKEVRSATSTNTATLRTVNAPPGTFMIYGINPMTKKINMNVGFEVTVTEDSQ